MGHDESVQMKKEHDSVYRRAHRAAGAGPTLTFAERMQADIARRQGQGQGEGQGQAESPKEAADEAAAGGGASDRGWRVAPAPAFETLTATPEALTLAAADWQSPRSRRSRRG